MHCFSFIESYLFPVFCISCEEEGDWMCEACFRHHARCDGVFCCPVCHAETKEGRACDTCQTSSTLSQHIALMPYAESAPIAELLHALKYQYAESTLAVFARCVERFFEMRSPWQDIDCIVPIPLHKKRFAERGFNQAEKIAAIVASRSGIPFVHGASRIRETVQQATLAKQERETNVSQAFRGLPIVSGKTVLLVDDVFTTGSTMQECAKALKQAGVMEVRGFSVARG